jgi:hypothetical protein
VCDGGRSRTGGEDGGEAGEGDVSTGDATTSDGTGEAEVRRSGASSKSPFSFARRTIAAARCSLGGTSFQRLTLLLPPTVQTHVSSCATIWVMPSWPVRSLGSSGPSRARRMHSPSVGSPVPAKSTLHKLPSRSPELRMVTSVRSQGQDRDRTYNVLKDLERRVLRKERPDRGRMMRKRVQALLRRERPQLDGRIRRRGK